MIDFFVNSGMIETTSRVEAKKSLKKRYFTGLPCVNGHISERFTSSGACVSCSKIGFYVWIRKKRKNSKAEKNRGGAWIKCETCGKDVYKQNWYLRNNKHHFCSLSCRGESVRGNSNPLSTGGYASRGLCAYDSYAHKLIGESVRRCPDDNGLLEVACKYCGKFFSPKKSSVSARIRAISVHGQNGELNLYCSDGCKSECTIYHAKKFAAGTYVKNSTEVFPELRKEVFKRDDHQCQMCGSIDYLECHHIITSNLSPITANDPDVCITLCHGCHKRMHISDGCGYRELRCDSSGKKRNPNV